MVIWITGISGTEIYLRKKTFLNVKKRIHQQFFLMVMILEKYFKMI